MRKILHFLVGVVVMCAALSYVAQSDMEDAKQEQKLYCSNVYDHTWPDFDGTYAELCDKDDIKKDSK